MSCIKTFPCLHQQPPGPVARLVAEQRRGLACSLSSKLQVSLLLPLSNHQRNPSWYYTPDTPPLRGRPLELNLWLLPSPATSADLTPHSPGQPGLRRGPRPRPRLMAKAALQYIRTHTSQYAMNQAWYWGVEADWQQEGIICRKHSTVMSLPASGTCACRRLENSQSLVQASLPPAFPLVSDPWLPI